MNRQQNNTGNQHNQCVTKQLPVVALHLYAKNKEVSKNGAHHDADGHQCTVDYRSWDQDQDGSHQFSYTGADSSPRFDSDMAENVDGLRCACEFEIEGLKHDGGRHQSQDDGYDLFHLAIIAFQFLSALLLRFVSSLFHFGSVLLK